MGYISYYLVINLPIFTSALLTESAAGAESVTGIRLAIVLSESAVKLCAGNSTAGRSGQCTAVQLSQLKMIYLDALSCKVCWCQMPLFQPPSARFCTR